jgi:hypothetical protein
MNTKIFLAILPVLLMTTTVMANGVCWNAAGTYTWLVLGTYSHDMVIAAQNPDGTFSGTGGYPAGGSPYSDPGQTSETITAGQVTGNSVTFTTTYNGPYNQGYSVAVSGIIAADGSMSGTSPWEWHTTSGAALMDTDCDGIVDRNDNCADVYNPGQEDCNEDEIGDACEVMCKAACEDTVADDLIPTTDSVGTNRWVLVAKDEEGPLMRYTTRPKGKSTGWNKSYTLEETYGCNCEQILDWLQTNYPEVYGDMLGHYKFGCSISVMNEFIMLAGE